jgi:YihY family inner membrane protein
MADGSTKGGSGVAGTVAAVAILAVAAARTAGAAPAAGDARHATSPSATARAEAPATTKGGLLGKLDLFQQRHRATSFPIGVVKKFGDDRGGRLAALIAYYGFFSLFPALLALVTILNFVLANNESARTDIANSALAQFPIIGDEIAKNLAHPLGGNTLALVVGLVGAVWAGLGMVQASQDAMNEVWGVERSKYPNFVMKRVRSVVMLVLMSVLVVLSTGTSQVIAIVAPGTAGVVLLFLATIVLDIVVFMVAFRVLTVTDLDWRTVLPGAVFSGIGYTVLQYGGSIYVTRSLQGASDTYGTFAVVIGLLSWIFLIAQIMVLGAEINVVRSRRMWPRSLFNPPATRGDRESHEEQAKAQKMDSTMEVDVEFSRPGT